MSATRSPSLVLALVLMLGASSALAAGQAGGRGSHSGNSPGGGTHILAVIPGQQDNCLRDCPRPKPLKHLGEPCHSGTHQETANGDERDCHREPNQ